MKSIKNIKYFNLEKNEKNGITLISLVITIVIMLILAAVSINLILGDNGLFIKTNDSAKKYSEASVKEELQTASTSGYIDDSNTNLTNEMIANAMQKDLPNIVWVYKSSLAGRYKGYEFTIIDGSVQMNVLQKIINNNRMVNHNQAGTEFWAYKNKINEITFNIKGNANITSATNLSDINGGKPWDIAANQDGTNSNTGNVYAYFTDSGISTTPYNLVIESSSLIATPEDSSHLFNGMQNVSKINNISNIDTSNTTNMMCMFMSFGQKMTGVFDLGSNFDTSNVTNMYGMFNNACSTITSLNIGDKFDTSKVNDMTSMFYAFGLGSLQTLDLGENFNTSNVYGMESMFEFCGQNTLTSLNLGDKFDTSKVTSISRIFSCFAGTGMQELNLGKKFSTASVKYGIQEMFYASNFQMIDLGPYFVIPEPQSGSNNNEVFAYTKCKTIYCRTDTVQKLKQCTIGPNTTVIGKDYPELSI